MSASGRKQTLALQQYLVINHKKWFPLLPQKLPLSS